MFSNRKPKIIATYDDDEDEENNLPIKQLSLKNPKGTILPQIKGKSTSTIKKTLTRQFQSLSSSSSSSSQSKSKSRIKTSFQTDENDDEDLDSVVIKPLVRNNSLFKSKIATSSTSSKSSLNNTGNKPKPKSNNDIITDSTAAIVNQKSQPHPKDLESQFKNEEKPSISNSPQYTKEYLNELRSTTPTRPAQPNNLDESSSMPIIIEDDEDIEMSDADDIDGTYQTKKSNKSKKNSGKRVRFDSNPSILNSSDIENDIESLNYEDSNNDDISPTNQPPSNKIKPTGSETEEEDFIALDPETIEEEKDLAETRMYNEYDMEEGVEMLDEDLALDKKSKTSQDNYKRMIMEEAINDMEDEESDNNSDSNIWERNQLQHSVVYNHGHPDVDLIDSLPLPLHSKKSNTKRQEDKSFIFDTKSKNEIHNKSNTKSEVNINLANEDENDNDNDASHVNSTNKKGNDVNNETEENTHENHDHKSKHNHDSNNIPPLPQLDDVLDHVNTTLEKMKARRNSLASEIEQFNLEIERIKNRQTIVQDKLFRSSLNYKLEQKSGGSNGKVPDTPNIDTDINMNIDMDVNINGNSET